MEKKRVVVIGAGFAGLSAVKSLRKNPHVEITLIDRTNHHTFQPLLYQVATAGLSPAQIAVPIRGLLSSYRNIEVIMGTVLEIDQKAQTLTLSSLKQKLSYDYLIVAAGARHSYFGNDQWEEKAPGLKTIEDALEIRRRVLAEFEKAESRAKEGKVDSVHFVIVGGGPTGTELAGALAELAQFTLRKDYRHIETGKTKIYLVEGGPKVLGVYGEKLAQRAQKDLEKMGVTVYTGQPVSQIEDGFVKVGEKTIPANVVIWAAGVKASPLGDQLGVECDRAGKVKVEPTLLTKDSSNLFVVGDLAHCPWKEGRCVPGLAPAALQMGRHAALNIQRLIKGQEPLAFEYFDKGSLATIGRHAAVGELRGLKLSGWIAWFGWLTIHLFYLVGFKNRLFVFFDWCLSYLFYRRGARLITKKSSDQENLPQKKKDSAA